MRGQTKKNKSNYKHICFIKIVSSHIDTSWCSFPYHYGMELKINIYDCIQNITIFYLNYKQHGRPGLSSPMELLTLSSMEEYFPRSKLLPFSK